MRRAAVPISCALVLVLRPALAQAPEVERRLDYSVAAGLAECPGEARLRQEVALRMGYDPFHGGAKEAVHVSVARRGQDLAALIEYLDEAGEVVDTREFTAPDSICACWALVTSMAVAIAFTLTPFTRREPPSAPCPTPPPAPPPAPAPSPAPTLSPAPAPAPAPLLQVGAGALLGLGLVDDAAVGGLAFVRLRWRAASLAMEGRVFTPAADEDERGVPLELRLYAGALVPCAHIGIFSGCGIAEVGVLRVRRGERGDSRSALLGAGFRGGLELPLGERLLVLTHADVLGAVAPAFLQLDDRDVWRVPTFSTFLGAALALSFK